MNKLPPAASSLLEQARAEDRAHPLDIEASLALLQGHLPFADAPTLPDAPVADAALDSGLEVASGFASGKGALLAGKGIKVFLATVALGGTLGGGAWLGATATPAHPSTQGTPARAATQRAEITRTPLPELAQTQAASELGAEPAARASAVRPLAVARPRREQLTQRAERAQSRDEPPVRAQTTSAGVAKPEALAAAQAATASAPAQPLELDLIDGALKDLRADDARDALAKLELHERLYAHGKFAVERRGLRVLTLCQLGRDEQARGERATFLGAHASTPIAARVRKACPPEGER